MDVETWESLRPDIGLTLLGKTSHADHLHFSICETGGKPVLSATVTPLKFLGLWEHIDGEL